MEWLYSLLSGLTDEVNLGNPAALGVLFSLGVVGDIGVSLLFTVEVFLFLDQLQCCSTVNASIARCYAAARKGERSSYTLLWQPHPRESAH